MRTTNGAVSGILKGIFVIAVLGIVAVIDIGIYLYNSIKNIGPADGAKVTSEIVQMDQPLPNGWRFELGRPDPRMKKVVLLNDTNGAVFLIHEGANSEHKTAPQLALTPARKDPDVVWTKEFDGATTIGGRQAWCIREHSKANAAESILVDLPNGTFVEFRTISNTIPFDPSVSKPLLDCIKSFKIPSFRHYFYARRDLKQGTPIAKDSINEVRYASSSDGKPSDCEMLWENIVGRKPAATIQTGRIISQSAFRPIQKSQSNRSIAVFATRDIYDGEILLPDRLEERPMAAEKIPVDAYHDQGEVVGWVARYPISKDSFVSTHCVGPIDEP